MALRSWVAVPADSDFPLDNVPLGIIEPQHGAPRAGAAIGERVVDLARLARAGLFAGVLDDAEHLFAQPSLNAFLARGRATWRAVRARLQQLLGEQDDELRAHAGLAEEVLLERQGLAMRVPVAVGDYVDFYSSLEHATNLGRILRPGGEPLLPNYRWIPIGYHGRTATIVPSGSAIAWPSGQRKPAGSDVPEFGPSRELDYELEMAFVTGPGNARGEAIPIGRAGEHLYGMLLLNDWSARDIQAWEYQPLGPFLGKSFATSVSPWLVSYDALDPYRVPSRAQDPAPLPYLQTADAWAFDLELTVELRTARMRAENVPAHRLSRVNFRDMYWNAAQQLAHITSNGTCVRPGDLFGSGTISGFDAGTQGSLIELTWRGRDRIVLPGGETRGFLEPGDEIVMRAAGARAGLPRIGFGEVRGIVG
jgi:fumarylacetoacetase